MVAAEVILCGVITWIESEEEYGRKQQIPTQNKFCLLVGCGEWEEAGRKAVHEVHCHFLSTPESCLYTFITLASLGMMKFNVI